MKNTLVDLDKFKLIFKWWKVGLKMGSIEVFIELSEIFSIFDSRFRPS